jgi:hypothetical protein
VAGLVDVEDGLDGGVEALDVEGLVDGPLGLAQREGMLRRDLGGEAARLGPQVVERHDLVDHADAFGLVRGHLATCEEELLRLAGTHLPRVPVVFDAADAHIDHGVGEGGVVRRDDEVAGPAQQEAPRDAHALHRGDRRLGRVAPPQRVLEEPPGLGLVDARERPHRWLVAPAVVVSSHALDVVARGEVLPVGLKDDDANVGIVCGAPPCLVELVEELERLGIGRFGPVERDRRDPLARLVVDEHGRSLRVVVGLSLLARV